MTPLWEGVGGQCGVLVGQPFGGTVPTDDVNTASDNVWERVELRSGVAA